MANQVTISCPWHVEKTPSCTIDFGRDLVVCFGCGHRANATELREALRMSGRDEALRMSGRDDEAELIQLIMLA